MHTRRGVPIPAPYDDPPEADPGLRIFLSAWRELNDEREISDGRSVHRISRGQIREWLIDNDYADDPSFRYEFRQHILALDAVYIPYEIARMKRESRRARNTPKLRAKAQGI